MRSTAVFATLLAAVTAALAAPSPATISKRQGPSFYIVVCTEPDIAAGTCEPFGGLGEGVCTPFPASFNDNISSLASTFDGEACTVYVNDGCTGDSLVVEHLQTYNTLPANLDNALSSFKCSAV
ncbi:hypothetical protein D9757_000485 [Collybiopsis confluens]|uniref:Uncharacterized protein n=1 Tax=Collybiopsis confluens TaxID=2823264 RepID=A0A8H5MGW9_9AGAR|nr:hypothetical protein D9757_000485 [Collybiopsis confluens]